MVKAKKVKGIECEAPVFENAGRVIETRLDEMLSFAEWVDDPRNVEQIHNLRIAAKRLRYSLELFRWALRPEAGGLIDEIKQIQEHIGNMRDADVMIERVLEIITNDQEDRRLKLLQMASTVERGSIAQRHHRIRSAVSSRTNPRDELAFYTLIAHRADQRDLSYAEFLATWQQMMETDFPGRVRWLVANPPEPEIVEDEVETIAASEQDAIVPDEGYESLDGDADLEFVAFDADEIDEIELDVDDDEAVPG